MEIGRQNVGVITVGDRMELPRDPSTVVCGELIVQRWCVQQHNVGLLDDESFQPLPESPLPPRIGELGSFPGRSGPGIAKVRDPSNTVTTGKPRRNQVTGERRSRREDDLRLVPANDSCALADRGEEPAPRSPRKAETSGRRPTFHRRAPSRAHTSQSRRVSKTFLPPWTAA